MSLALARLISANPGVTAQLLVRNWDDLLRSLRRQEIDFFVAETSTLEKESRLAIEPMAAHPLYFVARSGHPLAGRRGVTAAETFAHPLVSLSRISPRVLEPMRAAQRKAREQGVPVRSFPAVECNALGVAMQVVRNSDAIMVATLPSVSRELESGRARPARLGALVAPALRNREAQGPTAGRGRGRAGRRWSARRSA